MPRFWLGSNRPGYYCRSRRKRKHGTRLTDAVKLSDKPRNLRSARVVSAPRSGPVGMAFRFHSRAILGRFGRSPGTAANTCAVVDDGTVSPECKLLRRSSWQDRAPAGGSPRPLTPAHGRCAAVRAAAHPLNRLMSPRGHLHDAGHEAGCPADGRSASMSTTPCTDIVR